MGDDEGRTLEAWKAHRKEFINPTFAEHHDRIVKLMGDGMLVEFPSVVEAVQCAIEVQRGMAERNTDVPDRKIVLRIGINVGDIIVKGDDIHGDGVNVAARIESLADPGGVCISRAARDQVRDKLDIALEDLGEVEVKNIARPLRIFRVPITSATPDAAINDATPGVAINGVTPSVAGQSAPAAEATTLPNKPSIAVLPFDNMSGDPEQEFFADGLTEDILLKPNCEDYLLNTAQLIEIRPGETAQAIHRDEDAWSFMPKVKPLLQIEAMFALSDFTKASGATQVVPDSHLWEPDRVPQPEEILQAEMPAGSALFYLGATLHGGGANTTQKTRRRGMFWAMSWAGSGPRRIPF